MKLKRIIETIKRKIKRDDRQDELWIYSEEGKLLYKTNEFDITIKFDE